MDYFALNHQTNKQHFIMGVKMRETIINEHHKLLIFTDITALNKYLQEHTTPNWR
jgi:hypothetical protein